MFRSKYSLVFVGVLSACGGGSGSGTSTNNNNQNNNTAQDTFAMQVVYKDACGNETAASDAALLVHNSNYTNKSTVYADTSGNIRYQTDDDNITVSLITRGRSDVNGVAPIAITTTIDQPVLDKGKYIVNTYNTEQCECSTPVFDVYTPARAGERADSSITGYNKWGILDERNSYTTVSEYEFCKPIGGEWPLISYTSAFKNPSEGYGLLTNQLDMSSHDATLVGTQANIVSDAPNRQVTSLIDGKYHFRNYSYFENSPLFGFNTEQTEHYRVEGYDFVDIHDLPDIERAYLFTLHSLFANDLSQTFEINLPVIDYTRLFDIILSDSGRYNLSDIQGLDYISTSITGYNNDEQIFDWYLLAPVSGEVPAIDNIDISEFITDSELENNITRLRINAAAKNYQGINGYQDYQNKIAGRELSDFSDNLWNDQQRMLFDITTSNVEFTSLKSSLPTIAALQQSKPVISKSKMNNRDIALR